MELIPKEKAKKIFFRFNCETEIQKPYNHKTHMIKAKQSSLICVDEILTQLNKIESKDLSDLQYWGEVEFEINKL